MIATIDGFDPAPRKAKDGMYVSRSGDRLWIEKGVLFLPTDLIHPILLLFGGRIMRRVKDGQGKSRYFLRARDILAEAPHLAKGVNALAAKFGCEL